jgi:predicted permease
MPVWTSLDRLRQDVRYGLRALGKSPGFAAVAMLSLTLGIGANAALFSLADALLWKSLPVRDPRELRILTWVRSNNVPVKDHSGYGATDPRTGANVSGSFSYEAFREIQKLPQFSDLAAFGWRTQFTLQAQATSEFADGQFVSGNYFAALGVQPLAGRPILPDDDRPGRPPVAMLTYRCWERRFGLDPKVIGSVIILNQTPVEVVGVLPPGFQGLNPSATVDVFVPMSLTPSLAPFYYTLNQPDNWWIQIFGRVRTSVTEEAAASAVHNVLGHLIEGYAGSGPNVEIPRVLLSPGARGINLLSASYSTSLYLLGAVVGLVLLIAATNLANLLLTRLSGRRKEIAVRLSIGASRGRLVRQLVTENLLLAGAGGALGLLAARPLLSLLLRATVGSIPMSFDARIDSRTLAFTFAISMLVGILFGIAPALRSTQIDLSPALKQGGIAAGAISPRIRAGRWLVSLQVALSVMVLAAAGLFVHTLINLLTVDLGFRTGQVLTFRTDATRSGYPNEKLADVYGALRARIEALPGVVSVGMSEQGLIQGYSTSDWVNFPGVPAKSGTARPSAYIIKCSDSFLSTMHIELLAGRDLSPADGAGSPLVAVVNEAFAKAYLNDQSPLGTIFYFGDSPQQTSRSKPIEIVGLVKNAHYSSVRAPVPPTVYQPYLQVERKYGPITYEIRTAIPPLAIANAVRREVAAIDASLPLVDLRTMDQQVAESISSERLLAGLVSTFGLVVAIIAAIGLYGVMAYTVARRTSEMGIRLALGANRIAVEWLVLRESLLMVALGVAAGVPAALAVTGLVRKLLYGVAPNDPFSFAVAAVLMAAVGAFAAWIPARRAGKVDPVIALRCE